MRGLAVTDSERISRIETLLIGEGDEGLIRVVASLQDKVFATAHVPEDGLLHRVRSLELEMRGVNNKLDRLEENLSRVVSDTVSETIRRSSEADQRRFDQVVTRVRTWVALVFALYLGFQYLLGAGTLSDFVMVLRGL